MNYHQTMMALYDQAPARIRMRAKGYLSAGNLLSLRLEEGTLTAMVQGSEPDAYEVTIDLKNRKRKCTCPAHVNYRDTPCKHQILAILPLIGTAAGRP